MSDSENNPHGTPAGTGAGTIEQGSAPHESAKAPDTDNAEGQNYLLNFTDREAAEKGFKSAQAELTKKSQALAEATAENERLRMSGQISAMEDALQATQRERSSEAERAQAEAQARLLAELKERADEEGAGVLVDHLNSALYQQNQSLSEVKAAYENQIRELESKLLGQINTTALHGSSEWQRLSGTIQELRQNPSFKELGDEMILEMAKTMKGDAPDNERGSMPPGNGGSRAGVLPPEEPKGFDDNLRHQLKHLMKYSDEKIKEMEAEHIKKQRNQ